MIPARYTRTAVIFHWLIAVMMIANAALALSIDHLPDEAVRPAVDTHKSIGITVLGLALLRILWRVSHKPPPIPVDYARWERVAAHGAHGLLYLVMVALPLSGWLHDSAWKDAATHPMQLFGLVQWPRIGWIESLPPDLKEVLHTRFGSWHTWFGYGLYVLLALHVGGALKHQWIEHKPELQRMGW